MIFSDAQVGTLFTCNRLAGVWVKSADDRAGLAGYDHIWGLVGQSETIAPYSLPIATVRSVETFKPGFNLVRKMRRLLGF